MNDPGDAPDIVQEVFLKVFRNIGSFRGNSSLKTWIYRIAVNEAYNHRRWFCRHQRQEIALGSEEETASYAEAWPIPGARLSIRRPITRRARWWSRLWKS